MGGNAAASRPHEVDVYVDRAGAPRPVHHVEVCSDCVEAFRVYSPRELRVCGPCLAARFARGGPPGVGSRSERSAKVIR